MGSLEDAGRTAPSVGIRFVGSVMTGGFWSKVNVYRNALRVSTRDRYGGLMIKTILFQS